MGVFINLIGTNPFVTLPAPVGRVQTVDTSSSNVCGYEARNVEPLRSPSSGRNPLTIDVTSGVTATDRRSLVITLAAGGIALAGGLAFGAGDEIVNIAQHVVQVFPAALAFGAAALTSSQFVRSCGDKGDSPKPLQIVFDFLPHEEREATVKGYRDVYLGVIQYEKYPQAVMFDIDKTLYNYKTNTLMGRGIGAMVAFYDLGIPVGVFSLRDSDSVDIFLNNNPEIKYMIMKRGCDAAAALTRDHYSLAAQLYRDLSSLIDVRYQYQVSRTVPSVSVVMPYFEFGIKGKSDVRKFNIAAPKFVPAGDAILIDDQDWNFEYDLLETVLRLNGKWDDENYPLRKAIEYSREHFWFVEFEEGKKDFSPDQLSRMSQIMNGINGAITSQEGLKKDRWERQIDMMKSKVEAASYVEKLVDMLLHSYAGDRDEASVTKYLEGFGFGGKMVSVFIERLEG